MTLLSCVSRQCFCLFRAFVNKYKASIIILFSNIVLFEPSLIIFNLCFSFYSWSLVCHTRHDNYMTRKCEPALSQMFCPIIANLSSLAASCETRAKEICWLRFTWDTLWPTYRVCLWPVGNINKTSPSNGTESYVIDMDETISVHNKVSRLLQLRNVNSFTTFITKTERSFLN